MFSAKNISIPWFVMSLILLIQGAMLIYQYSAPMVLWLFMIPEDMAYRKITVALFCLVIGNKYRTGNTAIMSIMVPFLLLLLGYLINDFIRFGLEFLSATWETIVLIILVVPAMLPIHTQLINARREFDEDNWRFIRVFAAGLSPYLLNQFLHYHHFDFLH